MTREERCWQRLCERLQRDPATSEESDTCTLRVAFKHALAFADDEAAAMRERAAKVADAHATHALCLMEAGGDAITDARVVFQMTAERIAAAIRALSTRGEG